MQPRGRPIAGWRACAPGGSPVAGRLGHGAQRTVRPGRRSDGQVAGGPAAVRPVGLAGRRPYGAGARSRRSGPRRPVRCGIGSVPLRHRHRRSAAVVAEQQAAAGHRDQHRQVAGPNHRQPQPPAVGADRDRPPGIAELQPVQVRPGHPAATEQAVGGHPVGGRRGAGDDHPDQRDHRHDEQHPPATADRRQRGDAEEQQHRQEQRGGRQPEGRTVGTGHASMVTSGGSVPARSGRMAARAGPTQPAMSTCWDASPGWLTPDRPAVLLCVCGTEPRNQLARPRRPAKARNPLVTPGDEGFFLVRSLSRASSNKAR